MRRRCRAIYAERLTPLLLVVGAACSDDEAAPGNVVVREGMATAGGTATAGGAGGTATAGGAGGTATAGGAGGTATAGGAGGMAMAGGAGGMAMAGGAGGMAMAGGAGGMSMGGAGLAGAGGGSVGPPVVCDPEAPQSPSNGVVCTETCTDPCGLHALGNRVCECGEASADEPCDDPGVTVCFDCKTCLGVEDHPLYVPLDEAPLEDCPLADSELEDQKDCVENERCQSIREGGENRFCGCLGGEWDCDSKPSFLRD